MVRGKDSNRPRRGVPRLVVLPGGQKYVLTLLKIQSRYEDGTPEDLTLLKEDGAVEVVGGEEFLTAYLLQETVHRADHPGAGGGNPKL